MSESAVKQSFDRPFPALTPAQRYHFEVFGYVVLPSVLSQDETAALRDALYRVRDGIARLDNPHADGPRHHGAYFAINQPHHHYMGSIIESDPTITAYATHPRLVAAAEEVIGGEARIVEMNAHINRRPGPEPPDPEPTYGFHRGTDPAFSQHEVNGLTHCSFVKTLTNLTDLGPDDGGTVVIAGSHRVKAPERDLIALAYEDRSLIHQVIAPAGSTLLFAETLIHATGQHRRDQDRVIIITGYGTTLFPYWENGNLSEGFRSRIPPQLRILFEGKANWTRGPRYRTLSAPADDRPFGLGAWDDRPVTGDPG